MAGLAYDLAIFLRMVRDSMESKQTAGHFAALLTIVIWGTTFISTKILLVDFQPVEILFFRFVMGFFVLLAACPKRLKTTDHRQELTFAAAGLCGICLYYLLENIALTFTLVSNVGVILSTRRTFFYGILFMIPALFFFDFRLGLSRFSNMIYLFNIFYLGLGASALCFVTWNFAVKKLGAVKTSVYIYMVPVITVVTSVLILHERLTALAGIGTVLTLAGLFLSEYRPKRNGEKMDLRDRSCRYLK